MTRLLVAISIFSALGLGLYPTKALADVWVCEQPDGTDLFTDRGMSDCQLIQKDEDKAKGEPRSSQRSSGTVRVPASVPVTSFAETPRALVGGGLPKASTVFSPSVQRVPVLMVNQLSAKQESQGFYMANVGAVALVDLTVSHVSSGTGPEVVADSHFGGNLDVSLRSAVVAAAKAVGYDPRFLRVRLSVKTSMLQSGLYIEGPSAGAILAVGVASALLGDPLRPDVCMSGTIDENLDVGPVGGLEEKLKGCRQLNFREMIVPSGQTSMELDLKGKSHDIKITEVSTLGAAYQAATGQSIRFLAPR